LRFGPLPYPLTSLVGRQREIEDVTDLLTRQTIRLLTLTGPGGVGKSRLSLHSAKLLSSEFADGVIFVPLSPVSEDVQVPAAIAQAIGMTVGDSQTLKTRLTLAIDQKRMLMILDNFEQVISAGLAVSDLLLACPNLKILVTSRMPLRIQGEQEYAVQPLNTISAGTVETFDQTPSPCSCNAPRLAARNSS
jgi:predicted ATPase